MFSYMERNSSHLLKIVASLGVSAALLFAVSCAKTDSNLSNRSSEISNVKSSSGEPADGWMALDTFAQEGCSFKGAPIKGSTNQGGYVFEYESYSGTGPTGACRWYRLRNTPGRLYTPIRWKDSAEVWFDTALPACPTGSTCPPLDVIKQSIRVEDGRSILSYGVNKNEFSEDPSAFKRHQSEKVIALSGEFPRFVTTISGVIADLEQRPLQISIRVASYARGSKTPIDLGYEFQTGPRASNLSITLTQQNPNEPFRVTWGATSQEAFVAAAKQRELMWITGPEQRVQVGFTSPSIALNDQELLIISQGNIPIFVTSAPAYVPKELR